MAGWTNECFTCFKAVCICTDPFTNTNNKEDEMLPVLDQHDIFYCPESRILTDEDWTIAVTQESHSNNGLDANGKWVPYGDHRDWLDAIMTRVGEVGYTRKYWESRYDGELLDHGYEPCEWQTGAEFVAQYNAQTNYRDTVERTQCQ